MLGAYGVFNVDLGVLEGERNQQPSADALEQKTNGRPRHVLKSVVMLNGRGAVFGVDRELELEYPWGCFWEYFDFSQGGLVLKPIWRSYANLDWGSCNGKSFDRFITSSQSPFYLLRSSCLYLHHTSLVHTIVELLCTEHLG